jgi:hypothetical protein
MERRTKALSVSTTEDGLICIKQPQFLEEEDSSVVITADQVPVLVRWLEEAVAKLRGERSTGT